MARESAKSESADRQEALYAIADTLTQIADRIEGEPFEATASARLFEILDQPIRQCLDRLADGEEVGDGASAVSKARHKALAELSA